MELGEDLGWARPELVEDDPEGQAELRVGLVLGGEEVAVGRGQLHDQGAALGR